MHQNNSSSSQNESPIKRTSHYYKKKLLNENEQKIQNSISNKKNKNIQKKPKQAKLRAKQARQRKKIYIEKLQEKINYLQNELKIYKERAMAIQSSNSAFINLSKIQKSQSLNIPRSVPKKIQSAEYNQQVIKLAGIQSAFQSLYISVQTKHEQLAEKSIQTLRKKFGVAGQERIKWFEQLLLKIVSIMMPLHCRQLLENCENKEQFYKLIGCSQSMRQDRKLYFERATISRLCQSRPAMIEIKQRYRKIILSIVNASHKMIQQAGKMQYEIDKIQKSMNPLFVGRILIDLDIQRKKRMNLNEIFPVNYYKQQLKRIGNPQNRQNRQNRQNPQKIKTEQDQILYKSFDSEQVMERISRYSDQQNYLMGILSQ